MRQDLLIELGCEEIPATMIPDAIRDIEERMKMLLAEYRLDFFDLRILSTPRRLAIIVHGAEERQPDEELSVVGPPKEIAFMPDGKPGKAAIGFARAQGVPVEKLQIVKRNEKEFLCAVRINRGKPTKDLLQEILQKLLSSLSFPKMMRWGDGKLRFVRPIRSLLALFGKKLVRMELYGIKSSRYSFALRALKSRRVKVESPGVYRDELRKNLVIVDQDERRDLIRTMLAEESERIHCEVVPDEKLVEEVTFMVEFPSVSSGHFPDRFMELPGEILMTTLRHHQKCFSLKKDGKIANGFLAVINNRKEQARKIISGMERIAEGRLSDAEFFWREDRKIPMEKRIDLLKGIQFHERLGTYYEKALRIGRLASAICAGAGVTEIPASKLEKAARLSKVDLTTEMVKDFPELQGIMGGIYSSWEGMDEEISKGIYEHYLPLSIEDPGPSSMIGAVLSISDKIDTMLGCFGIGLIPSGSKDPFGLRRAAHGILKVCTERAIDVILDEVMKRGIEAYHETSIILREDGLIDKVMAYMKERMKFFFESEGHSYDTVNAALASAFKNPLDASMRIRALTEIRTLKDFEALAVSHKRIRNIISGQEKGSVIPEFFREPDERNLHARYVEVAEKVENLVARRRYLEALQKIAALRDSVDRFFDNVLVMSEEMDVRRNRISLLSDLSDLFMKIADFSEIVVPG